MTNILNWQSAIVSFSKRRFPLLPARRWVSHDNSLLLAFAARRDGAGGRPVRFGRKMAILSKYMSNFAKIRTDHSCHGIFRGIYVVGLVSNTY